MIRLENVNKYFNRRKKNELHVINDTSLELPSSGLVALLGPSGCGKTTLLNATSGLDKINKGKIYINDQLITGKRSSYVDKIRNLNIGYIFQNYYLINNKTVFENVAISLKMIGIKDKEEIKTRVNYVLETLGIYRYRNRLASMLSGGERQRVGIARAIVKDPSIIIADEPTGNLDSANTLEIMNIIKSISKKRLVLLVTHENDIAKFYADRIIELEDGKITKDYENKHNDNLDYRIENKFYLKDFKHVTHFENKDNEINIYNDKQNDIKLTIVVKNNNIYIKGSKNDKIEVVDNDSNIEFINEHYKQIDKSIYEKYEFDYLNQINPQQKLKYSSITSIFKSFIGGFKQILDYSIIKKLLLLGFLASGAFIAYCTTNIFGLLETPDKDFIEKNRYYYSFKIPGGNIEQYEKIEGLASADYIMPDKLVSFKIDFPYYYQLQDASTAITGSLASLDLITQEDLIYGKMPMNKYEIVIDKMLFDRLMETSYIPKQVGFTEIEQILNKEVYLKNLKPFKIVGVVSKEDPSIYTSEDLFINILANSYEDIYGDYIADVDTEAASYVDYAEVGLTIKEGRLPAGDYEVAVSIVEKDIYPLNKVSPLVIAGKKLTVVGYYEGDGNNYYINENTLKYDLISKHNYYLVMPKDLDALEADMQNLGITMISSYENSLEIHKSKNIEAVIAGLGVSSVILAISFIEIYLMTKASFLSRIKEIGIYRAIGVKKSDIYKMFLGEILAITTLACVPGCLFVAYVLDSMAVVSYFEQNYLVNIFTVGLSLIITYGFNIFVGLMPVHKVVKQTPAQILSRKDID